MRVSAGMTAATFLFHFCLLVTPVFLLAHNVVLGRAWGCHLPCLPEGTADAMTLLVIFIGLFFVGRRLFQPAAAYVTVASDWMVLGIVLAPFVTGYMAAHAWMDYGMMLVLHLFSGALWIMAIPFTRLNHMISFVFTRAYMGCEFGAVRNARDW
jgi:nitrate reductase gamma subunit